MASLRKENLMEGGPNLNIKVAQTGLSKQPEVDTFSALEWITFRPLQTHRPVRDEARLSRTSRKQSIGLYFSTAAQGFSTRRGQIGELPMCIAGLQPTKALLR